MTLAPPTTAYPDPSHGSDTTKAPLIGDKEDSTRSFYSSHLRPGTCTNTETQPSRSTGLHGGEQEANVGSTIFVPAYGNNKREPS
jgi:hypothetical protein